MLWRENQHLRRSTIPGTTQLTDTARLSVPIATHEPMTSGLPVRHDQKTAPATPVVSNVMSALVAIASSPCFWVSAYGRASLLAGSVQTLRNPGDQALIIREAVADDHHTLGGDFIFADILAMVATAHFDHDHDLAKLAVDLHTEAG